MKGYENKNVLITGGLGAVGSNLAIRLVSMGANVTILDNILKNSGAKMDNINEIKDKVEVVIGDIRNREDVRKSISKKNIIFNCAAQISHVLSMKDPYLDIDINLRGHITLLEECRKHNADVKVIYTGTRGQIGNLKYTPADETHPESPTDIYGVNKLIGEHYHIIYNNSYGIKTTSIRMVNTYGPRAQIDHPLHSIINWVIGASLRNEEIPVYEPGTQKKECNYIEDAIDAILLAGINDKSNGQIYNLGSGNPIEFIEIVKKVIKMSGGGKIKLVPWPKEREKIDVGDSLLSFEKIKNHLGWTPKTNIDDGLKKTIEFYKNLENI